MLKSVEVTLGGREYEVPMLNVEQLERVQDLLETAPKKSGFGVLRIALERAEPKVEKPGDIEATHHEIKKAIDSIMKLSGFEAPQSPNAKTPAHKPGHQER